VREKEEALAERRQELATLDQSIRLDERNLEVYAAKYSASTRRTTNVIRRTPNFSKQVPGSAGTIAGLGSASNSWPTNPKPSR
jgi:hypothetical protein